MPYFFYQLRERTQGKFPLFLDNEGIELTGDEIFEHPIIYFTSHFPFFFSDDEVDNLKKYLARGGTLLLDDCTGSGPFMDAVPANIQRIVPGAEMKLMLRETKEFGDLFHLVYHLDAMPNLKEQFMQPFQAAFLNGRPAILICPNDYGCYWEVSSPPTALNPLGNAAHSETTPTAQQGREEVYQLSINWLFYAPHALAPLDRPLTVTPPASTHHGIHLRHRVSQSTCGARIAGRSCRRRAVVRRSRPGEQPAAQVADRSSTIKITRLHATRAESKAFLKIETNHGISGWGELTGTAPAVAIELANSLFELLDGENPTRIEYLWQKLYRSHRDIRGGPFMCHTIAAIDMALWDITGRLWVCARLSLARRAVPRPDSGLSHAQGPKGSAAWHL